MAGEARGSGYDGLLLLEVALALVLLALMVALYWIPASTPEDATRWWRPVLPTVVFFLIVGLEAWRRKRGRRMDMRRILQESAQPPHDA